MAQRPADRRAADGPGAGAKLAGILAEQSGDAIVVGLGINVGGIPSASGATGSLPPSSLAAAVQAAGTGQALDRGELLAAVLGELEHWYRALDRPAATR